MSSQGFLFPESGIHLIVGFARLVHPLTLMLVQ
jgi:hypothetical protein